MYDSNTLAERMLLWIENLDREETLEEQCDIIWQQAIGMANLETDYDRSAAPAA